MVKEKSDKLKSIVSNFQILTTKDNSHQLLHTDQLIGVRANSQNLFTLFFASMRRSIGANHLSFQESLFLVEPKEAGSEESKLSFSQRL